MPAASMEVHAIWNRIDQLERLVLAQAKEIDAMRRSINCLSKAAQSGAANATCLASRQPIAALNNGDVDVAKCNGKLAIDSGRLRVFENAHQRRAKLSQAANNKQCPVHRFSRSFTRFAQNKAGDGEPGADSIAPTSTFQPYLINPFVHPSSAVPPATLRPVACAPHKTAANEQMSEVRARALSTRCANGLARWSIGPPSLLTQTTISDHEDSLNTDTSFFDYKRPKLATAPTKSVSPMIATANSNRSLAGQYDSSANRLLDGLEGGRADDQASAKRRLGVVELLTCFCPCLGMC